MKRLLLLGLFFGTLSTALSQVGIGTTTPDASSILDVSASNRGVLLPKVFLVSVLDTSLDGLSPAASGLLIYNTNPLVAGGLGIGYYLFNGSVWDKLITSSALVPDNDWTEVGANIERQSGDVYIGDTSGTDNDLYISDRIIDWDSNFFFLDPSSSSFVDEIGFLSGSISDPSIYFSDTDTGFYSPASGELAVTTNGSQTVLIDADGRVEFLGGTEADGTVGSGVIEIQGALRMDGNEILTNTNSTLFIQNNNGGDLRVDNSTLVVDASNNQVGVNLVNPHFTFDVDGPVMLENTTIPTPIPNHSGIYSFSDNLYAMDAAGNSTVISPHRFVLTSPSEPMAWSFYSRNESIGQQINVDILKALRVLEGISGEKLVFLADLNGEAITSENSTHSLKQKVDRLELRNKELSDQIEELRLIIKTLID